MMTMAGNINESRIIPKKLCNLFFQLDHPRPSQAATPVAPEPVRVRAVRVHCGVEWA